MMTNELSIIIVNFNTLGLLRNCLNSLMQAEGTLCDIIVVDNASHDGSAEMVALEFPAVSLIRNKENVGFSKANNQGIRLAKGKYVLLLNSDTVLRPGALDSMVEFLNGHKDAGGVTCKLLNGDGTIQASVSAVPGPLLLLYRCLRLSQLVRGDLVRARFSKYAYLLGNTVTKYLIPYKATSTPARVDNISGACLMLRREAITDVGLLDENFFMYFEDMDYCLRLTQRGWNLYYVPDGTIIHLVGMSSGGRMRQSSAVSYQSLFYFYRKHYSFWKQAVVVTIVFISTSLRWSWNRICAATTRRHTYRANIVDLEQILRLCNPKSVGSSKNLGR